jgi:hypothetical protein
VTSSGPQECDCFLFKELLKKRLKKNLAYVQLLSFNTHVCGGATIRNYLFKKLKLTKLVIPFHYFSVEFLLKLVDFLLDFL